MDKRDKGLLIVIAILFFLLIANFFIMYQDAKILKFESEKKCDSIGMRVLNLERTHGWKNKFVVSCYKEGTDEIKRLRLPLK